MSFSIDHQFWEFNPSLHNQNLWPVANHRPCRTYAHPVEAVCVALLLMDEDRHIVALAGSMLRSIHWGTHLSELPLNWSWNEQAKGLAVEYSAVDAAYDRRGAVMTDGGGFWDRFVKQLSWTLNLTTIATRRRDVFTGLREIARLGPKRHVSRVEIPTNYRQNNDRVVMFLRVMSGCLMQPTRIDAEERQLVIVASILGDWMDLFRSYLPLFPSSFRGVAAAGGDVCAAACAARHSGYLLALIAREPKLLEQYSESNSKGLLVAAAETGCREVASLLVDSGLGLTWQSAFAVAAQGWEDLMKKCVQGGALKTDADRANLLCECATLDLLDTVKYLVEEVGVDPKKVQGVRGAEVWELAPYQSQTRDYFQTVF